MRLCKKEERKKERKKEETSEKQDPAGVTGRVRKKKELETFVSASRHWYTGEFSTMSVIVFVDAETQ